MYWNIEISSEKAICNFANVISEHKKIELSGDFNKL